MALSSSRNTDTLRPLGVPAVYKSRGWLSGEVATLDSPRKPLAIECPRTGEAVGELKPLASALRRLAANLETAVISCKLQALLPRVIALPGQKLRE